MTRLVIMQDLESSNALVGELLSEHPQIVGDEILFLNGDKTAAYTVKRRRWCCPPFTYGEPAFDPYLILLVEKI